MSNMNNYSKYDINFYQSPDFGKQFWTRIAQPDVVLAPEDRDQKWDSEFQHIPARISWVIWSYRLKN